MYMYVLVQYPQVHVAAPPRACTHAHAQPLTFKEPPPARSARTRRPRAAALRPACSRHQLRPRYLPPAGPPPSVRRARPTVRTDTHATRSGLGEPDGAVRPGMGLELRYVGVATAS
eukprot:COSAG02_NODE_12000_length_1616_cov_4.344759_1_plen_115_part_10